MSKFFLNKTPIPALIQKRLSPSWSKYKLIKWVTLLLDNKDHEMSLQAVFFTLCVVQQICLKVNKISSAFNNVVDPQKFRLLDYTNLKSTLGTYLATK
jgi:hypothetical protein